MSSVGAWAAGLGKRICAAGGGAVEDLGAFDPGSEYCGRGRGL